MKKYELTDNQWKLLEAILPPGKTKTGKPVPDYRTMINGMLWIYKTDLPWRDLPGRYGKWSSVARCFYRWQKADVWERILQIVQMKPTGAGLTTSPVEPTLVEQFRQSRPNSENWDSFLINSLTEQIVVVDKAGTIIAVNKAWEQFAIEGGLADINAVGVGKNYFEVCNNAEGINSNGSIEVLEGIRAVSSGQLPEFTFEYPCDSPSEKRWFLLRATPLLPATGSVVISHSNISIPSYKKDRSFLKTRPWDVPGHMVIMGDLNGKITYWNNAAEIQFGWKADEVVGRSIKVLVSGASSDSVASHVDKYLERRRDGTIFSTSVKDAPIYDTVGNTIEAFRNHRSLGVAVNNFDITTQKRDDNLMQSYTKRLENLRDIERAVLVEHSPGKIAETALEYIQQLVPCVWSGVTLGNAGANYVTLVALNTKRVTQGKVGMVLPFSKFQQPENIADDQAFILEDLQNQDQRDGVTDILVAENLHSYMRVPLMVGSDMVGVLHLAAVRKNIFTAEHIEAIQETTDQLGIAIQKAQLLSEIERRTEDLEQGIYERTCDLLEANNQLQHEIRVHELSEQFEHEQRVLAEIQYDMITTLNSTLNFQEILDHTLNYIGCIVPHVVAHIILVESSYTRVVRSQGYVNEDDNKAILHQRWLLKDTPNLGRMLETRDPLVIADIKKSVPNDSDHYYLKNLHAYMGVPICLGTEVIGFFALYSTIPHFFTIQQAQQLKIFADQVAVALQNARLYERSQEVAILEERQRLSRELHDSVSQGLWSACLIADVLPALWSQNEDDARQAVMRLRQLNRGSLAEMRTLLLELRPASLLEVSFNDLLLRLGEVVTGRTGIAVSPNIDGQPTLTPEVKLALYRIAQESLTNIIRHAAAKEILINVHVDAERTELRISDNGRGFSTDQNRPGHLGLNVMRERAQLINADFKVNSQPGKGTTITVSVPAARISA